MKSVNLKGDRYDIFKGSFLSSCLTSEKTVSPAFYVADCAYRSNLSRSILLRVDSPIKMFACVGV